MVDPVEVTRIRSGKEEPVTIAITGASGHLGRRVAELVFERLDPSTVVLLSRTPSARSVDEQRRYPVIVHVRRPVLR